MIITKQKMNHNDGCSLNEASWFDRLLGVSLPKISYIRCIAKDDGKNLALFYSERMRPALP